MSLRPFTRVSMGQVARRAAVLVLTALFVPLPLGIAAETFTRVDHRTAEERAAVQTPAAALGLRDAFAPVVNVGGVDRASLTAEDAARASAGDRRQRIGVGRDVTISIDDGYWHELASGDRLWTLEVAATDVVGLRLHFVDIDLPIRARIDVLDATGESLVMYVGGGTSGNSRTWTPIAFGDRVRVELFVPAGVAEAEWRPDFAIDTVQLIYREFPKRGDGFEREGDCHNDVTCYSEWADAAKSVGWITFVTDGESSFCSGTMINTEAEDDTPYFLTANHCIGTDDEAESAIVYWLYQTKTCNGTPPETNTLPRSSNCRLMRTSSISDATLLMIDAVIPPGLAWSGWTSDPVSNGTACVGIHHPDGAYKRISFGNKSESVFWEEGHIGVVWNDGVTEGGSSGSGFFRSDTQQLVGQLWGGSSFCERPDQPDDYGAFSYTYGVFADLLAAGSDDSYEPNDTCASAKHLASGTYNGLVVKASSPDWYSVDIPARVQLSVSCSHQLANGNIDIKLYSTCDGTLLASGTGRNEVELMSYFNDSDDGVSALVSVAVIDDVRANYSLTVAACNAAEAPASVTADDGVECAGVNVSWTPVDGAFRYDVYRSVVNNPATATLVRSVDVASMRDTGAQAGTQYFYWVRALSACGISTFSPPDVGSRASPPSAPQNVKASDNASCTAVTVTWDPVATATEYEVRRNTTNNSATATAIAKTTSAVLVDDTIPSRSRQFYWVVAKNPCGIGPISAPDSGERLGIPDAPSGIAASDGIPCDRIEVSWNPVPDATGYDVFRSSTEVFAAATIIASTDKAFYDDASGELGKTYYYWVRAVNGCGASSVRWADAGFRVGPPPMISEFSVTDGTLADRVRVSWNPKEDVDRYRVWRSTEADFAGAAMIGETSGAFVDDTSAESGVVYFYWVQSTSECTAGEVAEPGTGKRPGGSTSASTDAARSGTPDASSDATAPAGCAPSLLGIIPLTVAGLLAMKRRVNRR